MQLDAVGIAAAHFGNLLPFAHRLVFFHQQHLVVCVSGQVRIVVLQDDQVAITAQTRPDIDHTTIGCSKHGITCGSTDIQTFVSGFVEGCQDSSARGPDPAKVVIRSRGRSSGSNCGCNA